MLKGLKNRQKGQQIASANGYGTVGKYLISIERLLCYNMEKDAAIGLKWRF